MNYQKIYDDLISSRKQLKRDKFNHERHHILPSSMGGTNENINYVYLTHREHFLAHWLLWRIHRSRKMAYAFMMMSNRGKGSSRAYTESIDAHRKMGHSEETRRKISISNTGKIQSIESRKKISASKKGTICSEETKKILSEIHKGNQYSLGYIHREESKIKISNALRERIRKPETFKKISKKLKGVPKSEEHRKKLSEVGKGRLVSNETRQILSNQRKNVPKSEEHKEKIRNSNIGQKRSEECKQHMREARKKYFETTGYSDEYKLNMSNLQKKISHVGERNCNFGKVWAFNDILKISKLIPKFELEKFILDGWEKGRKLKF